MGAGGGSYSKSWKTKKKQKPVTPTSFQHFFFLPIFLLFFLTFSLVTDQPPPPCTPWGGREAGGLGENKDPHPPPPTTKKKKEKKRKKRRFGWSVAREGVGGWEGAGGWLAVGAGRPQEEQQPLRGRSQKERTPSKKKQKINWQNEKKIKNNLPNNRLSPRKERPSRRTHKFDSVTHHELKNRRKTCLAFQRKRNQKKKNSATRFDSEPSSWWWRRWTRLTSEAFVTFEQLQQKSSETFRTLSVKRKTTKKTRF